MRPGILTSLALLLCVGASPPALGMAAGQALPRTSFRGEFDPVMALTVVYGREPWNDLLTPERNTFENGRDFIEPLFDAAYVEGGIDKHVVIATLTPRPRSQYNCQACPPMLGGAVFRREGDAWRIESTGLKIEQGHAWFDGRHGRLALVRVGPDRYGLLHQVHEVGQGHESMRASLILGVDGVLARRLVVAPVGGPGPGACGVPAQHLKVEIPDAGVSTGSGAPAGQSSTSLSPGFHEIVVDALWNEARCEPVAGDAGARASGRSCQRTSRYRYRDGTYVQIGSSMDVCRPLPEVTGDFRG
jgi:hypothetical protein